MMLSHEYRAIGKNCCSHHLLNVCLLNVEIDEENELVMVDEVFDVSQTDFRQFGSKTRVFSTFYPPSPPGRWVLWLR